MFSLLLGIIVLALGVYIVYLKRHTIPLLQANLDNAIATHQKLSFQKKSSEVRLGQISEHLAPFISTFPFDPKQARFLGTPIDLIVFADDKIIIVEVKSGAAQLTEKQRHIKKLVEEKKVEWYTHRVD